jgi:hypothetical protein
MKRPTEAIASHLENQSGSNQIEDASRRACEALSQRSSRRGFLARVGRLAFATVGVTIVSQILPQGRDTARAATFPCDACEMCGFCGSQCGCADCSGDSSACPNCACPGGWWEQCCNCVGGHQKFRYRDCYSHGDQMNGPCSQTKIQNCQGCGLGCCNHAGGPYGGNGCSGTLMCVRVINLGAC